MPRFPVLRTIIAAAFVGLIVTIVVGGLSADALGIAPSAAMIFAGPGSLAAVAAGLVAFGGAVLIAWLDFAGAIGRSSAKPGEKIVRRDPAVSLLALLQREGRLVDFLREDIAAYPDAQVGAAVRAIHASCRKVLDEHLALEPVRSEAEGARVLVERDFDASAIRLTETWRKPPFRGVLRHRAGARAGRGAGRPARDPRSSRGSRDRLAGARESA
jgi:hypothetical protein